jgi:predicted NAD/FAD-binding protein
MPHPKYSACRNVGDAMKIAIIGTGIAGNVAAYKLREQHDIRVFEAASYVGGHSNTVDVYEQGRRLAIDTGFIVFNDRTYPQFSALLAEIGQKSHRSEMSFSVRSESGAVEYNGRSLDALFAQRSNLFKPRFYRMIADILRFNRDAERQLLALPPDLSLGDYLLANRYSQKFIDHYLLPMVAAIWSAEPVRALDMPAGFLVRFFANHGLMQLRDRPAWRVVTDGSRAYVDKLVAKHRDRIHLDSPVRALRRTAAGIELRVASAAPVVFDAVFLACHSDQALRMLVEPSSAEHEVLGAIRYQQNEAILHSDVNVMPARRKAWAAWNYYIPQDPARHVAVTYNMNILQGIEAAHQYCVTLNYDRGIDPGRIIRRISYEHPVFSSQAVRAQQRQQELNQDRLFFCGAYWGNGFHEDGVVSALAAVRHFEEWQRDAELHIRRAG